MSVCDVPRFSMSEAARRVGVHVATVWRWALHGVRGHRLRTVLIGGRRFVLVGDLDSFLTAINGGRTLPSDDRQRRADDAGRQLDGMGVRGGTSNA